MKHHKILITIFALFVLSVTAYPQSAEAGDFSVMVVVGNDSKGPKTDSSAAHLKSMLKALSYNNFSVKRAIPVKVGTGKTVTQSIGFKNINVHLKLISVKNNVAKVQISFTSGGTTHVKQTISLPVGKNYTFVRPVGKECVVVVVTLSKT